MGKRGRAAVVVLGDIGRSPRMQYHALSLARQAGLEVDIVAYGGSQPHSIILEHPAIHLHKMTQWPVIPKSLPKILHPFMLLLKPIVQFIMLLWFLCVKIPAPDIYLVQVYFDPLLIKHISAYKNFCSCKMLVFQFMVYPTKKGSRSYIGLCSCNYVVLFKLLVSLFDLPQNPPSVPTLVAVRWASWLRRSSFVVDWHNFGYTLLALSVGRRSRFVAVYRWIEKRYGKMADGALCVTRAMQHELQQNWGINATVLYDQPPEFFCPASLEEKHKLFARLDQGLKQWPDIRDWISHGNREMIEPIHETLFTTMVGASVFEKPHRPALIVSSTSWTPDEDFGILLEAAVMYDRRVAAILNEDDSADEDILWQEMSEGRRQHLYPRLVFIITGKGPEKEKYEAKIRKLHLKRVAFRTMWLSAEDYPLLLGSADLGVSLHTSSSGLDLPMKVVDMFGCGLPVCAASYSCIDELVKVERNGLLFSSSSELADELLMLFKGFPDECGSLKSLKNGALETESTASWDREWEEHAKPLVLEVITRNCV